VGGVGGGGVMLGALGPPSAAGARAAGSPGGARQGALLMRGVPGRRAKRRAPQRAACRPSAPEARLGRASHFACLLLLRTAVRMALWRPGPGEGTPLAAARRAWPLHARSGVQTLFLAPRTGALAETPRSGQIQHSFPFREPPPFVQAGIHNALQQRLYLANEVRRKTGSVCGAGMRRLRSSAECRPVPPRRHETAAPPGGQANRAPLIPQVSAGHCNG
jgi:hypothetical protein